MQRQFISLDNINYMVELTKYDECKNAKSYKFVMFRHYDIINDIAVDKDIYFVDSSLFENTKENISNICWPIINGQNKTYSTNKNNYAETLNDIYNIDMLDNEAYRIYEKDTNEYKEAFIPCDEIKIYKPINRKNIDSIIHISNIINDINIHYYCKPFIEHTTHICDEISFNNLLYNEYISLYIPNLEYLFKDDTFYYIEDMNLSINLFEYTDRISNINNDNNDGYMELSSLIRPYIIHKNELTNEYVKIFSDILKNTEYNYINIPINIVLYGYDNIINSFYTQENNYLGFTSFVIDNTFVLKSRIGFDDDGIISLINEFDYPNKYNFSLTDAYFYYNKIDNPEEYYNFNGWSNETFYDMLEDELGEEFNMVSFNASGYYIMLSNDPSFKNVLYSSQHETKTIQDFAFALNEIFNSWQQYPTSLFARAVFIDKYLSKIIYGNVVVITKEQFKYCINDKKIYKLKLNSMGDSKYNFIHKINCIVKKENNDNSQISLQQKTNKIIYKPIFYKTTDSQNIRIRHGVTQNIGINLSNYLAKVNNFILEINNHTITEYSRNESFVIFNINANLISNNAGYYNILTQDNEYITSGEYVLY
jgi:hypothetical protein